MYTYIVYFRHRLLLQVSNNIFIYIFRSDLDLLHSNQSRCFEYRLLNVIFCNDSFPQTNALPSSIGFQVYTYFVTKFMTRTSVILKHRLSSNRSLSQHNLGQASRGRTSEMRLGNRGLPSPDVNAHATMNNPVACHNYPTSAENNPFFTLIRRV